MIGARLFLVIAICGAVGAGLSALYLRAPQPPSVAARYLVLFEDECLARLGARETGQDKFSGLAAGAEQLLVDEAAGLLVTQTRNRCVVEDRAVLMSAEDRAALEQTLPALIESQLPQLSHPGDDMAWDFFFSRAKQNPRQSGNNWGVMVVRLESDTQDELQITTTTLVLPRD